MKNIQEAIQKRSHETLYTKIQIIPPRPNCTVHYAIYGGKNERSNQGYFQEVNNKLI